MKSLAPTAVTTQITTRDPKGLKFMSIVDTAYNKAGLSEKEAQRVNDTPGLADLIANFIALNRVTDQFKDEEVESRYGYLSGYKPNELALQVNRLHDAFPNLVGQANTELRAEIESGKATLPANAEGWFAIPNIWKDEVLQRFGGNYSQAVQKVLDAISTARDGKFHNYRKGQITEKQLRQRSGTAEIFRQLSEAQGNPDILIIAAQFGKRHAGRSVRRAHEVIIDTTGEFGLSAFAVGCMLLTHPERLMNYDDLWVDTNDEFDDPDSDVRFGNAPFFLFFGGRVEFGAGYVDDARDRCGSASGFASQN